MSIQPRRSERARIAFKPIDSHTLRNWFTHHPPEDEATVAKYEVLRNAGHDLANTIVTLCPPGADTTAAVRKVREAVMTANAAIACGGDEVDR